MPCCTSFGTWWHFGVNFKKQCHKDFVLKQIMRIKSNKFTQTYGMAHGKLVSSMK